MTDRPNLPLPDQLADVRAQLKALEMRELELRNRLIADPDLRTGAAWVAEVKEIETNRVDLKELRAMHKDLVEEYTFPNKTIRLELNAITPDGEIIRPRRGQKNSDENLLY